MYLMLGIGIISFAILFFEQAGFRRSAGFLVKYSMMAVAPALISSGYGRISGYFQGMQNMKPTAVSQIIEQFFRVGFGLFLAYTLFKAGPEMALFSKYGEQSGEAAGAAGATFGATIGSVAGLLMILLIYALSGKAIRYRIAVHAGGDRERGEDHYEKHSSHRRPHYHRCRNHAYHELCRSSHHCQPVDGYRLQEPEVAKNIRSDRGSLLPSSIFLRC